MTYLGPLFSHDPLLNRTLMAAITSKYLPDEYISAFSPETVLANIYFDLKSHIYDTTVSDTKWNWILTTNDMLDMVTGCFYVE